MGSSIAVFVIFFGLFVSGSLPAAVELPESDTTDSIGNLLPYFDVNGVGSEFDFQSVYLEEILNRADETEDGNCSERSIDEFPKDLFSRTQRQQGAIILHAFAGVYAFLMVALICNDYFLPAVDCICNDLNISQDVAAATFMATATCAPELFVNIIGTFLTESDLGIGAVVGSGVFNTFGVAACGGLAAIGGIQMDWWPLTRDCIIYSISIGLLTFMMWDGSITWVESSILMCLYFIYFVILFCNKITSRWAHKFVEKFTGQKTLAELPVQDPVQKNEIQGIYRPYFHGELLVEYRNSIRRNTQEQNASLSAQQAKAVEAAEPMEEYVEPDTPFTRPTGELCHKMWWLFLWPLRFILFITVPDCRYKKLRKFYPFTFIMCIVWIAITSYIVSWMITVIGDTIGIADAVMGLTFLAAGGSLPEAVSSVITARRGNGAMGLSNSIGANTLDILLCLGFPWLIKTVTGNQTIEIVSSTITFTILALMGTVVTLYVMVAASSYRLNKKVGFGCLLGYAIFLIFAVLLESNAFFFVNYPMCPPKD